MKRIKADWNHTSQEIDEMPVTAAATDDWLKEVAWQLAKLRESLLPHQQPYRMIGNTPDI